MSIKSMPSYHLEIKSGQKQAAKNHARYISRQGKHAWREDLIHTGHGNMPSWTNDNPDTFWAAADEYERVNGAAYREYVIAIPNEFTAEQQLTFTARAIESLIGNRPYQYAIHGSVATLGGTDNVHSHVMYSDRIPDGITRTPKQTFSRHNAKHPELGGCRKAGCGLPHHQLRNDVIAKRQLIAELQNEMLEQGGFDARVDHRSHKDRGIEREPEWHLGAARISRMTDGEKTAFHQARNAAGTLVSGVQHL